MKRDRMMCISIPKEKETDFRLFTVLNGGKIENVECSWILVTEQLPPEGIEVLVSYEYKSITDPKRICYAVEAGNYYQGDWGVSSFKYMHKGADPKVGAWKPMPEPYYGEEDA